ncbi:hypothetical protein [Streptomyces sp. NPDC058297]|uniref:hypothetical protein n=1 Tax=Streptomyces sp. NPDC058297 TaxID=3346433 RepID=UPI0036ED79DC
MSPAANGGDQSSDLVGWGSSGVLVVDGDRFQQQAEAVVAAQGTFLDICREDLSYATKSWQLLRRHKERRFLRSQASR